jgi:hypothetical protein
MTRRKRGKPIINALGDRTALVAARFGLTQYVLLAQRHRRRVAAQKASTPK